MRCRACPFLPRCRHRHKRCSGGGGVSLLSQDPVYFPLTTPFPDLLTAADGRDRSLELRAGQVREGGVGSTQSTITALGHTEMERASRDITALYPE